MKPPEALDPILLNNERSRINREIIPQSERYALPDEQEILALLEAGLDSYRITKRLGCDARHVVNVARRANGFKSPIDRDIDLTDEQAQGDRRLHLFPPA